MELLRQLGSGPRKLPVIVMTGHGDVPLAVEAMKLGALDFLEKPFEDDRLISMIETALAERESGSKSEALSADMAARVASLTQRERQVMQGLVTGPIEQGHRPGIRHQPADGGGLPGQRNDQDAGR